jgi:hypothetical protein
LENEKVHRVESKVQEFEGRRMKETDSMCLKDEEELTCGLEMSLYHHQEIF